MNESQRNTELAPAAPRDPAPDGKRPFVSVIVPVYNGEEMIGPCIESLLAQDYPKKRFEILVVDNGSTDATAEIIRRYPVRYVLEDQVKTSYGARNRGAREGRGELLAFCDADETALPHWLRALVDALEEDCGGASGPMLADPAAHDALSIYAAKDANPHDMREACDIELAVTGNVLYRRDLFDALGGFNTATRTGADLDFSDRVRQAGKRIRFTPEAVVYHRPRTSLGRLFRHEVRCAYGGEWFHRERPTPLYVIPWLLAASLARSAGAAAKALLLFRRPPGLRIKLGLIGLNVLLGIANTYGKLRYRMGREIPRDW
jgi:glycosyltransferase involved in cell wall biosynthesis